MQPLFTQFHSYSLPIILLNTPCDHTRNQNVIFHILSLFVYSNYSIITSFNYNCYVYMCSYTLFTVTFDFSFLLSFAFEYSRTSYFEIDRVS